MIDRAFKIIFLSMQSAFMLLGLILIIKCSIIYGASVFFISLGAFLIGLKVSSK